MQTSMVAKKPPEAPLKASESFSKERELIHRQMMSSVSHDLKTPLASIIGSLEIHDQMNAHLSPEKKQMLLDTALQEAYRLDNFITNILDMAKLENGQVRIKHDHCDVGELVQGCKSQLASRLKDSTLTIKAVSGPLAVTTDPTMLQQAIRLLLDNAVKYGGTPSLIDIEFGRGEGNRCYLSVRDQGPGIPQSEHEAIFCKYNRLVKRDAKNAGTGLGLAICREIMTLLGGSVSVANHKGGGAIFTLQFPAA